jgi:hypothetical protein
MRDVSRCSRIVKTKRPIFISLAGVVLGVACTLTWLLYLRPPSTREITAALDATIIPKLSLRDAPYPEAVDLVLEHVRRLHPELDRVQFVSHFPADAALPSANNPYYDGKVTLNLTAIPANEALRYIAAMSSLGYAIRDGTIYFYAVTADDGGEPPLTLIERLSSYANGVYCRLQDAFNQ